jgi:Activator of Hsp90 ATPase homolog 1-like protein
MTSNPHGGGRILGSLRSADGQGVVRMEDRLDAGIDDVWSALTDPRRLGRWTSEVEGDLRLGGDFHARYLAVARAHPCLSRPGDQGRLGRGHYDPPSTRRSLTASGTRYHSTTSIPSSSEPARAAYEVPYR